MYSSYDDWIALGIAAAAFITGVVITGMVITGSGAVITGMGVVEEAVALHEAFFKWPPSA